MIKERAFVYRNGFLCADAVPLQEIVGEHGAPLLVINEEKVRGNARQLTTQYQGFNIGLHFSIEQGVLPPIVRVISDCGFILKTSSIEELYRLLNVGVSPKNIFAAGSGKSSDYIAAAILANVNLIEINSLAEAKAIANVSRKFGKPSSISIKLDFERQEATNHEGLDLADLAAFTKHILKDEALNLKGLCLSNTQPIVPDRINATYDALSTVLQLLRNNGLRPSIIDLNNSIDQAADPATLDNVLTFIQTTFSACSDISVIASAGQDIIADAGALLITVCHIETTEKQRIVFVDLDEDTTLKLAPNVGNTCILPLFSEKGHAPINTMPTSIIARNKVVAREAACLTPIVDTSIIAIAPAGAIYSAGNVNCVIVAGVNHALVGRRMSEIERMTYETSPEWMDTDCVA